MRYWKFECLLLPIKFFIPCKEWNVFDDFISNFMPKMLFWNRVYWEHCHKVVWLEHTNEHFYYFILRVDIWLTGMWHRHITIVTFQFFLFFKRKEVMLSISLVSHRVDNRKPHMRCQFLSLFTNVYNAHKYANIQWIENYIVNMFGPMAKLILYQSFELSFSRCWSWNLNFVLAI